MTGPLADWIAAAATAPLAAGLALILAGGAALIRFPDFYTRIHAAQLVGAVGAPLVLAGIAMLAFDARALLKLAALAGLLFLIAPTAAHMLASAAHGAGLTPVSSPQAKRPAR
jgi:multicomponent Na+:H+ antiporter subunit G